MQLGEESRSHLEGHLTTRQRFLRWGHRGRKASHWAQKCVLGPQVVRDRGSTMEPPWKLQVLAVLPSLQVWGRALGSCCYRPSEGLTVAGRISLEEGREPN